VPLFPTPGNHDLRRESVYRRVFAPVAEGEDRGGPHYAFEWGSGHFVSVSTPEFSGGHADGAPWLSADLAAAQARPWRIVFLHEPLYSGGKKYVLRGLRATLGPLLEAGGVHLLLAGHQHFYERADPACQYVPGASVLEIISGGGGANLDPPVTRTGFPRTVSATHYLRVRVAPTHLDIRAVDLDGHVLDHVRRAAGAPAPCRSSGWPQPIEK
jgi:acid phosphatase